MGTDCGWVGRSRTSWPRPLSVRDAAHGRRVTYSPEGLHPAHDAVPRQVRVLHVRPAAGPARAPVPVARPGAAPSPPPAPRPAATRRSSPSASAPRSATRPPASGSTRTATTPPSTTWPPCAGSCSTRPACSPTPTPARCYPDELAALRTVAPSQGMMLESLNPDLRRPPGLARQDARAAAGHARGGGRAGHPVHHRDPRRDRRVAAPTGSRRSRPSPRRTAARVTSRR